MPEGPEVYSYGIKLYNYLYGSILRKIIIKSGKYKRKPFINYKILDDILPSKILSISTYGKLLLIGLQYNYFIVISSGMTGFITINDIKHNHLELIIDKSSKIKSLYYNDQRNFGNIYLLEAQMLYSKLSNIGPDLLDDKLILIFLK